MSTTRKTVVEIIVKSGDRLTNVTANEAVASVTTKAVAVDVPAMPAVAVQEVVPSIFILNQGKTSLPPDFVNKSKAIFEIFQALEIFEKSTAKTPSDVATLEDSLVKLFEQLRIETTAIDETKIFDVEKVIHVESTAIVDLPSINTGRPLDDTASVSEFFQKVLDLNLKPTDIASLYEAIVFAVEKTRTDTASIIESISLAFETAFQYTISVSDTASLDAGKLPTDSVTATEERSAFVFNYTGTDYFDTLEYVNQPYTI